MIFFHLLKQFCEATCVYPEKTSEGHHTPMLSHIVWVLLLRGRKARPIQNMMKPEPTAAWPIQKLPLGLLPFVWAPIYSPVPFWISTSAMHKFKRRGSRTMQRAGAGASRRPSGPPLLFSYPLIWMCDWERIRENYFYSAEKSLPRAHWHSRKKKLPQTGLCLVFVFLFRSKWQNNIKTFEYPPRAL